MKGEQLKIQEDIRKKKVKNENIIQCVFFMKQIKHFLYLVNYDNGNVVDSEQCLNLNVLWVQYSAGKKLTTEMCLYFHLVLLAEFS